MATHMFYLENNGPKRLRDDLNELGLEWFEQIKCVFTCEEMDQLCEWYKDNPLPESYNYNSGFRDFEDLRLSREQFMQKYHSPEDSNTDGQSQPRKHQPILSVAQSHVRSIICFLEILSYMLDHRILLEEKARVDFHSDRLLERHNEQLNEKVPRMFGNWMLELFPDLMTFQRAVHEGPPQTEVEAQNAILLRLESVLYSATRHYFEASEPMTTVFSVGGVEAGSVTTPSYMGPFKKFPLLELERTGMHWGQIAAYMESDDMALLCFLNPPELQSLRDRLSSNDPEIYMDSGSTLQYMLGNLIEWHYGKRPYQALHLMRWLSLIEHVTSGLSDGKRSRLKEVMRWICANNMVPKCGWTYEDMGWVKYFLSHYQ